MFAVLKAISSPSPSTNTCTTQKMPDTCSITSRTDLDASARPCTVATSGAANSTRLTSVRCSPRAGDGVGEAVEARDPYLANVYVGVEPERVRMHREHRQAARDDGESTGSSPHRVGQLYLVAGAHAQVGGGLPGEDDARPVYGELPFRRGRPPELALEVDELNVQLQRAVFDAVDDLLLGALEVDEVVAQVARLVVRVRAPPYLQCRLGNTERAAVHDVGDLGRVDRVERVELHDEPVGRAAQQLLVAPIQRREERFAQADYAEEDRHHGGEGEESQEGAPGRPQQVAERHASETASRQRQAADDRSESSAARRQVAGPDGIDRLDSGGAKDGPQHCDDRQQEPDDGHLEEDAGLEGSRKTGSATYA